MPLGSCLTVKRCLKSQVIEDALAEDAGDLGDVTTLAT